MLKKEFLPLALFVLLVIWLTGSAIARMTGSTQNSDTPPPVATPALLLDTATPTRTPPPPSATHTPTVTVTPTRQSTQLATQTPTPSATPTQPPTRTPAAADSRPSPTSPPTRTPSPTPVPPPVVISRRTSDTVIFVQTQDASQKHTLWCIERNSDTNAILFHPHAAAPTWTVDGKSIAFFGEEGISELGPPYKTGIWVVDYGSNCQALNPRLLVEVDHVQNMAWSPDGTKLAFEVNRDPAVEDSLVRVVDAGDGGDVVDPDSDKRIPVGIFGKHPAWSPDGQKLIVNTCVDANCGLWQFNFLGEREKQLTFNDTDSYPALANINGDDYLAFSRKQGPNQDIYLLRLGDEAPQPLTNRNDIDTTPIFSPNGQEIYIYTNSEGGGEHWRIETIPLSGPFSSQAVVTGIGESKLQGLARPAIGQLDSP